MNKSILANAAWYRDNDGRTGFKPKEWDGVKGGQRSQVKQLSNQDTDHKREKKHSPNKMQLHDLLRSVSPEQQMRPTAGKSSEHIGESSKAPCHASTATVPQKNDAPTSGQQVSTGEGRARQPISPERTKSSTAIQGAIIPTKIRDEQSGSQHSVQRAKLIHKDLASAKMRQDATGEEQNNKYENYSTEVAKKREEKRKPGPLKSSEEENDIGAGTSKSDITKERSTRLHEASSTHDTDLDDSKERMKREKLIENDLLSAKSVRQRMIERSSNEQDNATRENTPISRLDATSRTETLTKTDKTRSEPTSNSNSPTVWSPDINANRSNRSGFKSLNSPHGGLSDRRDSTLSESSRLSGSSHKNVTFSDRVEVTEIESRERRNELSHENSCLADNDETSDEEEAAFTRPRISPRRQMRSKQAKTNHEGMMREQELEKETGIGVERESDVVSGNELSRENSEDSVLKGFIPKEVFKKVDLSSGDTVLSVVEGQSYSQPTYGPPSSLTASSTSDTSPVDETALDSYYFSTTDADYSRQEAHLGESMYDGSQPSVYEEDLYGPDRTRYFDDREHFSLQTLPMSVRRAIVEERMRQNGQERYISDQGAPMLGSMSRLHDTLSTSSGSSSSASFPNMPRSASGYFEASQSDVSLEHPFDHYTQSSSNAELNVNEQLQLSYYDNVPYGGQSNNPNGSLTSTGSSTVLAHNPREEDPVFFLNSIALSNAKRKHQQHANSSDNSTIVERSSAITDQDDFSRRQLENVHVSSCSTISQPALYGIDSSSEEVARYDAGWEPHAQTFAEITGIAYSANQINSGAMQFDVNARAVGVSPRDVISTNAQFSIAKQQGTYGAFQPLSKAQQADIIVSEPDGSKFVSPSDVTTLSKEERLRRQFVSRFGSVRAPIERLESDGEEYPIGPNHRKSSYDSLASANSRESVISAASIRAEALVRRNFNY
ncbi:unnamed protein product [Toxocara canis]|uniref:PDZ domain-containing protein n=1 Tax=Toxocara canis TaxID=6265 RepID=A0A183ULC2_TOXCA|nr:unnamed protein product [Toxocara canis]